MAKTGLWGALYPARCWKRIGEGNDNESIDPVLTRVGLPPALALVRLHGGTGDVYRVDLNDGSSVVLKNFDGEKAPPELDAFASNIAASAGIPVSKYLLVDDIREQLRQRGELPQRCWPVVFG